MSRSPLRARRLLVVAPHPDDEVIGAWGLIRACHRRGARIAVLVVSDGGASHPASIAWPPQRLMPERRRETLRALARLRVPRAHIRFLALPDGRLDRQQERVTQVVGRALQRCPAPDVIVGPVADDAHADHRAVAQAIARLPRRGAQRLGYRIWPGGARRGPGQLRVMLGCRGMAAKRHAIRSYRTQMGMIADAEAGFVMTYRHLRAFARPVECFERLR